MKRTQIQARIQTTDLSILEVSKRSPTQRAFHHALQKGIPRFHIPTSDPHSPVVLLHPLELDTRCPLTEPRPASPSITFHAYPGGTIATMERSSSRRDLRLQRLDRSSPYARPKTQSKKSTASAVSPFTVCVLAALVMVPDFSRICPHLTSHSSPSNQSTATSPPPLLAPSPNQPYRSISSMSTRIPSPAQKTVGMAMHPL